MTSSGKGRFYGHLASSAFAIALKSNKMKKLLESPDTAFIPENLPSVVIFEDLTSKPVQNVVVAHKIPITENQNWNWNHCLICLKWLNSVSRTVFLMN
jgi:hypothetical protein